MKVNDLTDEYKNILKVLVLLAFPYIISSYGHNTAF